MPIIAITTSNSTSVKAILFREELIDFPFALERFAESTR
jgi:hypothetical protein